MGLGFDHASMLPKELFPVPNFVHDAVGCGTSRSSHRRHNARSHRDNWQSDCIRTLNTMAGYGAADTPSVLNSAQSSCLDFVRESFLHQAYPGDDASGEALLGLSSSAYAAGIPDVGPTAPYAKARVAWPAPGSHPARLEQLLGAADRNRFVDRNLHMLRSSDVAQQLMEDSEICPHIDPVLKYNRQSYVEFLAELHSRGLLRWRRQQEGHQHTLGIFFVTKNFGSFSTPERPTFNSMSLLALICQLLLPLPVLTPMANVVLTLCTVMWQTPFTIWKFLTIYLIYSACHRCPTGCCADMGLAMLCTTGILLIITTF